MKYKVYLTAEKTRLTHLIPNGSSISNTLWSLFSAPQEQVKMVKAVTYYAAEEFANNIFESCKDVYSPTLSGPAFIVICGPWGPELCTPKRLFEFCGAVDNPYVPFKIEYNFGPDVPDGMILYNNKIVPCNEGVMVSSLICTFGSLVSRLLVLCS